MPGGSYERNKNTFVTSGDSDFLPLLIMEKNY